MLRLLLRRSAPRSPDPTPPALARRDMLKAKGLKELPGALLPSADTCKPGEPVLMSEHASDAAPVTNGNIKVTATADGLTVTAVDTGKTLFTAKTTFSATSHIVPAGFKAIDFSMTAGDKDERIYGLGQGNWTGLAGCATGVPQVIVPLERNGQTVELLQRKFHVTIPFAYSTAGYGFLFNMPGYVSAQATFRIAL